MGRLLCRLIEPAALKASTGAPKHVLFAGSDIQGLQIPRCRFRNLALDFEGPFRMYISLPHLRSALEILIEPPLRIPPPPPSIRRIHTQFAPDVKPNISSFQCKHAPV